MMIQYLSHSLHLPIDQIKIFIYLLACYPLSLLYIVLFTSSLRSPLPALRGYGGYQLRYIYLSVLGNVVVAWMFGWSGLAHVYASCVVIYGIIWFVRMYEKWLIGRTASRCQARLNVSQDQASPLKQLELAPDPGKESQKESVFEKEKPGCIELDPRDRYILAGLQIFSFIFTLSHVAFFQYARFVGILDPSGNLSVDLSIVIMMLAIKQTSIINDTIDRLLYLAESPSSGLGFRNSRILKKLPSLLEYLGYVWCMDGLLTGPVPQFWEFKNWAEGKFATSIKLATAEQEHKEGLETHQVGSRREQIRVGLVKLVMGICILIVWQLLLPYFGPKAYFTEPIINAPFLIRVLYMYFVNMVARMKYYMVWFISEGSLICIGLGYNGKDSEGRIRWDRMQNVDPFKIETAPDLRTVVSHWNMATGKWLHDDVHVRIMAKGHRRGLRANLVTYLVSAFWHGFYPGYYFTFLSGAILTVAEQNIRRKYKWWVDLEAPFWSVHFARFYVVLEILGVTVFLWTHYHGDDATDLIKTAFVNDMDSFVYRERLHSKKTWDISS